MAKHLVAIVGRPNAGKSTIVNHNFHSVEATVRAMRGVTRTRSYHYAARNGHHFTLIDTAGIEKCEEDAF